MSSLVTAENVARMVEVLSTDDGMLWEKPRGTDHNNLLFIETEAYSDSYLVVMTDVRKEGWDAFSRVAHIRLNDDAVAKLRRMLDDTFPPPKRNFWARFCPW